MASATTAPRTTNPGAFQRAGGAVVRATIEYLPAALLLVGLVGLWELLVRVLGTEPYILPAPSRIWMAFLDIRGTLPEHTRTTMGESLFGLFWAAVVEIGRASCRERV